MTQGRLLFAAGTTVYILVALQLEERDLQRELGVDYDAYRCRVPMLVPGLKRHASTATPGPDCPTRQLPCEQELLPPTVASLVDDDLEHADRQR
jgi:hypothetical protein